MMKYVAVLLIGICTSVACNDSKKQDAPTPSTTSGTTAINDAGETVDMVKNDLPPITQEIFNNMYENCTYIDYIWHDLPFSLSQTEPAAVKTNITFISAEGLEYKPAYCKSIGRKSYQIDGDIVFDADIYLGKQGCNYYIFLKDNKPMYLNLMTQNGIDFYKKIIESATKQRQQIIDQANG